MTRVVTVALYHRDEISKGHRRQVFGYEAYHWGIIVMPEDSGGRDCNVYEATDASEIDPVTFRMSNPNMDWWLRAKVHVEIEPTSKLIGQIIIGQVPEELSDSELHAFFSDIQLPIKNRYPQQSCVSWTQSTILALQRRNWAWKFNIEQFKDWALAYADRRMGNENPSEPEVTTYTSQE